QGRSLRRPAGRPSLTRGVAVTKGSILRAAGPVNETLSAYTVHTRGGQQVAERSRDWFRQAEHDLARRGWTAPDGSNSGIPFAPPGSRATHRRARPDRGRMAGARRSRLAS